MKKVMYALLGVAIMTACTVDKRLYSNGYSVNWKNLGNRSNDLETPKEEVKNEVKQQKLPVVKSEIRKNKPTLEPVNIHSNVKIETKTPKVDGKSLKTNFIKANVFKSKFADTSKCDNILLGNGDEISAKVVEITPTLIKYKKCNNLNGPLVSIEKSKVFSITYSNGSKEVINRQDISIPKQQVTDDDDKRNGFAIASLIFGILGIPVLAIVFGAIQMHLIRKSPTKYGGRGMAVAGYILGVIWLTLILLLLFAV
jgi:hypothetical protein